MNRLIALYSRAGENYVSGQLKMLDVGNTRRVGERIHDLTGIPLFLIEQQVPYAVDYNTCLEEVRQDQEKNARPALTAMPEQSHFDELYLGFPDFWGTMPMAVFTFLENLDTDGTRIHPFCTHEGSGFGHSLEDLRRTCPKATITEGLAVHGSRVDLSEDDIRAFVTESCTVKAQG